MGIMDQFKDVVTLAQTVNNMPLLKEIMSLESEVLVLQEENRELKQSIRQLQQEADLKAKLVWEAPFYWTKDGDHLDGPFCQKCWDSEKKPIHLTNEGRDVWKCHECKSRYPGPSRTRI